MIVLRDNHLLVEYLSVAENKSRGGIILPNVKPSRTATGRVIDCGPGRRLDNGTRSLLPLSARRGDVVQFGAGAGQPVTHDGERDKYVVIREDDVVYIERT